MGVTLLVMSSSDVLQNCKEGRTWNKFVVNDGFVFRANKLCILASFVRILLSLEAHGGGLMGHFGVKKTEDVLATHFFWPKMRRDDRGGGVPSFDEMIDIALVEVDFDDPTTNVRGRRALAIAEPTPRGY